MLTGRLAASLIAMGRASNSEVELIMRHFEALDVNKNGRLQLSECGDISNTPSP